MGYPAALTHDRIVMRVLLSEVTVMYALTFTINNYSFTWSVSQWKSNFITIKKLMLACCEDHSL